MEKEAKEVKRLLNYELFKVLQLSRKLLGVQVRTMDGAIKSLVQRQMSRVCFCICILDQLCFY